MFWSLRISKNVHKNDLLRIKLYTILSKTCIFLRIFLHNQSSSCFFTFFHRSAINIVRLLNDVLKFLAFEVVVVAEHVTYKMHLNPCRNLHSGRFQACPSVTQKRETICLKEIYCKFPECTFGFHLLNTWKHHYSLHIVYKLLLVTW